MNAAVKGLPYRQAKNLDLFAAGAARMQIDEAIAMTQQSLAAYGPAHDHWAIAWSGGKDSTATLTLTLWMIETGMVPAPKRLSVLYADTRMEIPPLAIAAEEISARLRQRGHHVQRVVAEMDRRYMVYLLGRGVPPPNNGTLRWCTQAIKITPMEEALREATKDGSILMITGVRQGESAIRDRRIEMSCSKDGAECGQGWYQQVLPQARGLRGQIATLAPILHWRVCHIWEWLRTWAPTPEYGGLPTAIIADAYGGDEAEEINARTGCVACPLASRDTALETVVAMPHWAGLAPLLELKPIYRELRLAKHRIRKAEPEILKSGRIAANPQRMGPLRLESRLWALEQILSIQARCEPTVDLIDAEEEARIRALIAAKTWPNGWSGDEAEADAPLATLYFGDGSSQPTLI